jgi:hypothetical protein
MYDLPLSKGRLKNPINAPVDELCAKGIILRPRGHENYAAPLRPRKQHSPSDADEFLIK